MNCMMNIGQINRLLLFINIKKGNTVMPFDGYTDYITLTPFTIARPNELLGIKSASDIPKALNYANIILNTDEFKTLSFISHKEWVLDIWEDITEFANIVTFSKIMQFYDEVINDKRFLKGLEKATVSKKHNKLSSFENLIRLSKFNEDYDKYLSDFPTLLHLFRELELIREDKFKSELVENTIFFVTYGY